MQDRTVWNSVPQSLELRDIVDDLCQRLEKAVVNDTGLPQPYMDMDLRRIKAHTSDLIEDIYEKIFEDAECEETE